MPFDCHPETDPLADLDIVPVPEQVVIVYKAAYEMAFRLRKGDSEAFAHYAWITHSFDNWRRRLTYIGTLERFLSMPMRTIGGAPSELVELAQRVQREMPDAVFSVDVFENDPILNVAYWFNGSMHKVCLGIWDHGEIKAIAQT